MRLNGRISIVILCIAAFIGCSKQSQGTVDKQPHSRNEVISFKKIVTLDTAQIKALADDRVLDDDIKYGITCYKLSFWTLYEKELVPSDALVVIPDYAEGDTARIATYFHGTVIPISGLGIEGNLPSFFNGENGNQDVRRVVLPLASAGYCVIAPDYTGYGPTADREHPFIYYPELAKSCLDGLFAAKKVLDDMFTLPSPADLYLCGWSQGGGAALYMQRYFESMAGSPFRIKATSTLAGPFNVNHFICEVLNNPGKIYAPMALYTWAGYSINRFDPDLYRPTDQIFRIRIYNQIGAFLMMSNTPEEVFQDFFVKNILNNADTEFIQAMAKCSTSHGWRPVAPIYIHHGTDDPIVPFFNAQDAYDSLSLVGKVSLLPKQGGGHDTFVAEYTSQTIDEFLENH